MKLVRNWYWKPKFRRFLKKRGALEKYCRDFKGSPDFFERVPVEMWLSGSFLFLGAPEGLGYWKDLNLEWIRIVEKTKFIAK